MITDFNRCHDWMAVPGSQPDWPPPLPESRVAMSARARKLAPPKSRASHVMGASQSPRWIFPPSACRRPKSPKCSVHALHVWAKPAGMHGGARGSQKQPKRGKCNRQGMLFSLRCICLPNGSQKADRMNDG